MDLWVGLFNEWRMKPTFPPSVPPGRISGSRFGILETKFFGTGSGIGIFDFLCPGIGISKYFGTRSRDLFTIPVFGISSKFCEIVSQISVINANKNAKEKFFDTFYQFSMLKL